MKTPWPMTKPTDATRRSQGGIEEMDGDVLAAIRIRYLLLAIFVRAISKRIDRRSFCP
jgi:hypothetical protein